MMGLDGIIKSKSKTFLSFCFCFLFGIAAASLINKRIDFVYLYLICFVFISFAVIFRKNRKFCFLLGGLLLIALAFARYNLAWPSDSDKNISYYNGERKEITGYVSAEPDIRQDGVRYILRINKEKIKGKIYFKSLLYPRYEYGDVLQVSCDLAAPEPIEDFHYDMHLARLGVFSACYNPEINIIGTGGGNFILRGVLSLKQVIAERINLLWHEPYAGFVAGLLYGYRGGLGNLQDDFNRAGVTHIVAISGYNISIIAFVLITIFVRLWIPRKNAFWFISLGILLFVIFAGAGGSVIRAGIMGFLVLLAKYLGRPKAIANVLGLTAVLMTLFNPLVLIWDAGFQLSFLATLGLIYLSPYLQRIFCKVPEFIGLKESFVSTVAAIIATLPLILFQFGRLSIVAPIVNVLILWLIPWIMVFGFVSVLASFIFYPLGQVLSWVTFAGLKYITVTVHWFSSLLFAAVDFTIPLWAVGFLYILMVIFLIKNKQKL